MWLRKTIQQDAGRQAGGVCAREMPTVGSPIFITEQALDIRRLATWVSKLDKLGDLFPEIRSVGVM